MKKRLTAIVLLCALLFSTVSCSSDEEDKATPETTATPVDTTVAETEEPRIEPELPDIKFDGANFDFYQYENGDSWPTFQDIWVEEQDADPIHDAVFKRNSLMQERYDVKFTFTKEDYNAFIDNVKRLVDANEDIYEVIIPMGHCIPRMYAGNVFYNLHEIDYLDFDKPWYDARCIENFTLAGYMPFTVSDMIINDKAVASCVYFNKKLVVDYNVNMDFYKLVDDGEWTMDKMIEAGKKVSDDLNGDLKFDDNDRFGIVCNDAPVFMMFHSAGCRYITKDEEGYPELSFESEYNYTAIKYFLDNIMYDATLTNNNSFRADAKAKMFESDQGLFTFGSLGGSQNYREMESDFGIIPVPKYQASQEDYASSVSVFAGSLLAVPIISQNIEMIGVIVEAMSAESKYTLIPAFYDKVLKDKSMRDPESERMLDIIIGSMVFDVGDYYNLANFPDLFLRITGSVYDSGNTAYPKRTSDIASFYEKYRKALETDLKKLIKVIDKWNA